MRYIWNPWHGCEKKSEGCKNCYMFFLDSQRGMSGSNIFRVKNNFDYPLHRDKNGNYKIPSGEFVWVCMTSDFFLEAADNWRTDAWKIMKIRSDIVFIIITKRPERIMDCLPHDWNDGWSNVWLNVTTENQIRADERAPILLELPFKHKGFSVTPFIGKVSLKKYLISGAIDNVWCGGENYDGARPLHYSWVKQLSDECKTANISFAFFETGTLFIKDNKIIKIQNKTDQMKCAFSCNLNYESTCRQTFQLQKRQTQGSLFENSHKSTPFFKPICNYCFHKKFCLGCTKCGRCI